MLVKFFDVEGHLVDEANIPYQNLIDGQFSTGDEWETDDRRKWLIVEMLRIQPDWQKNVLVQPILLRLNPNPPMDRDGRREDSGRG